MPYINTNPTFTNNRRLAHSDVTMRAYLAVSQNSYDCYVKNDSHPELVDRFLNLNGNSGPAELVMMDAITRFRNRWDKVVKDSPLPKFVKSYKSRRFRNDGIFPFSAEENEYTVYFTLLGLESEYNPHDMIRSRVMIKLHVAFDLVNEIGASAMKQADNEVLNRFVTENSFVLSGEYRVDDDVDEIVYIDFNKIGHERNQVASRPMIVNCMEPWIEL